MCTFHDFTSSHQLLTLLPFCIRLRYEFLQTMFFVQPFVPFVLQTCRIFCAIFLSLTPCLPLNSFSISQIFCRFNGSCKPRCKPYTHEPVSSKFVEHHVEEHERKKLCLSLMCVCNITIYFNRSWTPPVHQNHQHTITFDELWFVIFVFRI